MCLYPSPGLGCCLLWGALYLLWKGLPQSPHVPIILRSFWPAFRKYRAFSPALKPFTAEGSWWCYYRIGFICFFVAYQVNDLQPGKCVIRPWHDRRSCYILSRHWQKYLPTWLWQLWSTGFGISFNVSPTPCWFIQSVDYYSLGSFFFF